MMVNRNDSSEILSRSKISQIIEQRDIEGAKTISRASLMVIMEMLMIITLNDAQLVEEKLRRS
jgi:hypothetical protein